MSTGMKGNDIFQTYSHCDLTVWNIYWGDGVRWHLSNLFSLWPHCMKYLLTGRSTMIPSIPLWEKVWKVSSYSSLSIITSVSEVTMRKGMKGVIVLHPFNKYFSQWSHNVTPFTPFLIVTSLYEVFIERMEYDETFHTFSHCDLIEWSNYWEDGVRWHLSYIFSLWPIVLHPFNKYFSQWSHNGKRYERYHRTPSSQLIRHTVRSQWEKVWWMSSYSILSIITS
jgi:hypothetical protein